MDNYFTSCGLATDLLALKTNVVGTMRKNKGDIPKELLPNRGRPEMLSIFVSMVNSYLSATSLRRIRQ